MAKSTAHKMCSWALLNGKYVCKDKDLLTECENRSRKLQIPNITKGCLDTNSIKKAVWAKNKDDLKTQVLAKLKIDDRYSDDRIEQEHLEICPGLTQEQRGLNLNDEMGKQIFWRRMAPKLKNSLKRTNLKS